MRCHQSYSYVLWSHQSHFCLSSGWHRLPLDICHRQPQEQPRGLAEDKGKWLNISFSFLRGVCDISSRRWEQCEACGLSLRSTRRSRSSIVRWRIPWRRAQTVIRAASTVTSACRTGAEETGKPLTRCSWNLLPLCFSVWQEMNRWLVASRFNQTTGSSGC